MTAGLNSASTFKRTLSPPQDSAHIAAMVSGNDDRQPGERPEPAARDEESRARVKPKKPNKDPARPTRAQANRPDFPPTDPELDRKSTRLNSSHIPLSRMPSSA